METQGNTGTPFLRKDGDHFHCLICMVDAITEHQNHKSDLRHVGALKRFNMTFKITLKGVICRYCKEEFEWSALKMHAIGHKVEPWYDPPDKYKNFYKNHIVEWDTQFYCLACNFFLPEWSTACLHTIHKNHRKLTDDLAEVNDFSHMNLSKELYRTLVSNAFTSVLNSHTVQCTICNCHNIGIKNIESHVRGVQHIAAKAEYFKTLKALKVGKDKESAMGPRAADTKRSESGSRTSVQDLSWTYIVKHCEDKFYCIICESVLCDSTAVNQHTRGGTHAAALKKYGCEFIRLRTLDYIYHCDSCNCPVLGVKNVYQHIMGFRHKNSLSEMRRLLGKKLKTKEESAAAALSVSLPTTHIQGEKGKGFLCRLCDVDIERAFDIQKHLAEKVHQFLEGQMEGNILHVKGNDYHCKCCNCTIPGIENVYGHIKGQRHENSLSRMEGNKVEGGSEVSAKIKTPEQSENTASPQSVANDPSPANDHTEQQTDGEFPKDHLEKRTNGELLCRLCNEVIPCGSNIQEHIKSATHLLKAQLLSKYIEFKAGNEYYCSCCSCSVPGIDNVYGHVKGNRHVKSLDDLAEHTPEASNEDLAKIETPKQLENNPSPQYSANNPTVAKDHPENQTNEEFLKDHIEKQTNGKLLCRLCDEVIPNGSNVQEHVTQVIHLANAQLLLKNISFKGGNGFYCKCCACAVPGVENVYRHVNGIRHATSLNYLDKHKVKAITKASAKIESPKPFKDFVSPQTMTNDLPLVKDHTEKQTNVEFPKDHLEEQTNGKLLCRLCDEVTPCGSNVQEHLTKATHLSKVQLLSKYIAFEKGNVYYCSCCSCSVPGIDNVYGHVKGNRHVKSLGYLAKHTPEASNEDLAKIETPKQLENTPSPQYSANNPTVAKDHPENQTNEEFLKDHIEKKTNGRFPKDHLEEQTNGELLCRLCNEVIPRGSNVQEHLTSATHLPKAQQLSKYIEFKVGNEYYCRCCSCAVPGIENVYGHMKGNRHAKTLRDFDKNKVQAGNEDSAKIGTPKQLENTVSPPSTANEPSPANDHTEQQTNGELPNNCTAKQTNGKLPENYTAKQTNGEMSKNYIAKQTNGELLCQLCDVFIFTGFNVQDHLMGETHLSKAQHLLKYISFKEFNKYYCKCCDCKLLGTENVYLHLNGTRHAASLNESKKRENGHKNSGTAVKSDVAKSACEDSSRDHIVKLSDSTFCCKLCGDQNIAHTSVDQHLAEKRHVDALKHFTDEILLGQMNHYCTCCNCVINGDVYAHLREDKHLSFHNTTVEVPKVDGTNISDRLEIHEETPATEKLSQSPFSQGDFPLENIPCSFCNVVFLLSSDFHNHMTSHVDKEIEVPNTSDSVNGLKDNSSDMAHNAQNGIAGSQLTKAIKDLEQVEHAKLKAEASFNGLPTNGSVALTRDSNPASPASLGSVSANGTAKPQRNRRWPKTMSTQRFPQLLNYDKDHIHDMRDKLREIELGMKLCLTSESGKIYCLVCRKEVAETMQNYFEHLSTVDHCEYLEGMEKDHALFEVVPNQYSEYDLVRQYMEEVSEELVRCHACSKNVNNVDCALKLHMSDKNHEDARKMMHLKAKANFENIKPRLQCDWYDIHRYLCIPCSKILESEISFAKHLRSTGHAIVMRKSTNERVTVYDFCSPCALLWFGFRNSCADHRESNAHKTVLLKELDESKNLSRVAAILCAMAEDYVIEIRKHIEKMSGKTRAVEEALARDLEMAVKSKFPDVTAYPYVSRTSGLRAENDDFEIFLDCGNMYDGKEPPQHEILYLMTSVHQCLKKDQQRWNMDTLLTSCQSSVLKARHRASEITCKISFENGLPVENAALIMYFVDIFPPCGNLILFLSEWLLFCNLTGPQGISYNALYWCVIFYLQTESVLPSVASLMARKTRSRLIAGWEVGASLDRTRVKTHFSNLSTAELLTRFFAFYAKFDYRHDVVCPLLGVEVKKQAFVNIQSLPIEMALYVDTVNNANEPRLFRIDSVMCVQDPLNLQRNLTESMSKASLMYFRAYCSKSLEVL